MANVELRDVSKVFPRGVTALSGVNLEVRDGEIFVLLGPNGSGKTTLLRLIAGLEELSAGEIRIGERVVNRLPPRRRSVAMVFQGSVLYPHLTVERNIIFGLNGDWKNGDRSASFGERLASLFGAGWSKSRSRESRDQVRYVAQRLGIEHLLDRYPRQLSGGECQRVALGRALVRHPAVFLLDEPWSNVDVRLRRTLRLELRRLRKEFGGSTILVTHDHAEALAIGDRIAVLEKGRVHQVGTPAEIVGNPQTRFVAEFVGNSPMNFVAGVLQLKDGDVWFESSGWRLKVSAGWTSAETFGAETQRDVWLGFRAHAVLASVDPVEGESVLPARILAEEPDAGETSWLVEPKLAEVAWQDGPLVVRSAANGRYHVGQEVWLRIEPDQLQLFDSRTGDRINLGLEAKPK